MNMEPEEFYFFSEKLVNTWQTPASNRSAISRAYYAAHHCGVKLIKTIGFNLPKKPKHDSIWIILQHAVGDTVAKSAIKLGDLYEDRRRADYELGKIEYDGISKAKSGVTISSKIVQEFIDAINSDQLRKSKLKNAIEEWAKADQSFHYILPKT